MKIFKFIPFALIAITACESAPDNTVSNTDQEAIENGLLPGLVLQGESLQPQNIFGRLSELKVPGASVAVVRDGKIEWASTYGWANFTDKVALDTNTLFQAASISKPITAIGVLKLVEDGKLDLDTDVNTYLKSWQIPDSDLTDSQKVTLRLLLTHTAGVNVHGFAGYEINPNLSTVDVLNGKGNSDSIQVVRIPGTEWTYSGGGYVIIQQIIEDVTGEPFDVYMDREILPALNMSRSTFAQPLPEELHSNTSLAYRSDMSVNEHGWNTYPEIAPAGLWTTPRDLASYFLEINAIYTDRKTDGVLSPESLDEMLTPRLGDWGLGPALEWSGDSLRMQHGGKNMGFSNIFVGQPKLGNAAIIMTNGDNGTIAMREILRSVSMHYQWNWLGVDTVIPFNHSDAFIEEVSGTYLYQLPNSQEPYLAELVKNGKYLEVINPEGEVEERLIAESDSVFIDLTDGDVLTFTQLGDSVVFDWNGMFTFIKQSQQD